MSYLTLSIDSLHMLNDVLSLVVALYALKVGCQLVYEIPDFLILDCYSSLDKALVPANTLTAGNEPKFWAP